MPKKSPKDDSPPGYSRQDGQHRKELEQRAELLSRLQSRLNGLSSEIDYSKATRELDKYLGACHEYAAHWFAPILETCIRHQTQAMEQETEQKTGVKGLVVTQRSELSKWVNEELHARGLAISHKGQACRISAAGYTRHPEIGRFQLSPVGTHNPAFTRKDIHDFFPLVLMKSPPRIEPRARWADKVGDHRESGESEELTKRE